jgi:hypothetical protein
MSKTPTGLIEIKQKLNSFEFCEVEPDNPDIYLYRSGAIVCAPEYGNWRATLHWDGAQYRLKLDKSSDYSEATPIKVFFSPKAAQIEIENLNRETDLLRQKADKIQLLIKRFEEKPIEGGWCGHEHCGLILYSTSTRTWCASGHQNPPVLDKRPLPPMNRRWKGPGTQGIWVSPGENHIFLSSDDQIWERAGENAGPMCIKREWEHCIEPLMVRITIPALRPVFFGAQKLNKCEIWTNLPDEFSTYQYQGTIEQIDPDGPWKVFVPNPENQSGSIEVAKYIERKHAIRFLVLGKKSGMSGESK